MSLDLRHYSPERNLKIDPDYRYPPHLIREDKPCGFWVSVGDDWKQWTTDNDYERHRWKYEYQVTLAPDARILTLTTEDEVLNLADRYPYVAPWSREVKRVYPDWPAIYQDFDGIVIAPYQHLVYLRMDTLWYGSWDAASGCIWNLHTISTISNTKVLT